MGLMDGPLEIGPAHGPLGLTGVAGLLRPLDAAQILTTRSYLFDAAYGIERDRSALRTSRRKRCIDKYLG